jgi:Ketol-acid reductoisomerase
LSKIYYNKDADIKIIKKKTIAIIGYGSQGHAHARNLHDSGVKVMDGLRKNNAFWKQAEKKGLRVVTVPEAAQQADIMMILIPHDKQREKY